MTSVGMRVSNACTSKRAASAVERAAWIVPCPRRKTGMGTDRPARISVLAGLVVLSRPRLKVRSGTDSRRARVAEASAPPEKALAAFRSPRERRANVKRASTSAYDGLRSMGVAANEPAGAAGPMAFRSSSRAPFSSASASLKSVRTRSASSSPRTRSYWAAAPELTRFLRTSTTSSSETRSWRADRTRCWAASRRE